MANIAASIVLITRNKLERIQHTLKSLSLQNTRGILFEVVIVNNGSTVDYTSVIELYKGQLYMQYTEREAASIAKARNIGIKMAKGDIIIFLDDDILFGSQFIYEHIKPHLESKDEVVVVGDRYNVFFGNITSHRTETIIHNALLNDINQLNGTAREDFYAKQTFKLFGWHPNGGHIAWTCFVTRNASVSKKLLEKVNYFDEKFLGWGGEDIELGYRLYNQNARFIYQKNAKVYHMEHPVGKNRIENLAKNMNYFCEKYSEHLDPKLFVKFINNQISLEEFYNSNNALKLHIKNSSQTYFKMIR
ncbi:MULTISPECIES: glycosyltransferase family 2 protein [Bacillus cereus group]|uniref:Glycosyltransferase n=1 Tax=Bacillus cereus TaxID=1396 RepID=A0ABD7DLD9_BACCE|nr:MULTISPECIES: glycosyltransferase [Bacillus cereus group]PGL45131.1 hypothetical protein CN914_27270 [Bacillus thuringiensis]QRY17583.1 glycosyltransferase [Bacillus cereus]